jgi:hypothetical protein
MPSLELVIAYDKALSKNSSGGRLPAFKSPVEAYQKIAGLVAPGTPMAQDPARAQNLLAARKSVLDFVKADIQTFRTRTGGLENAKIDSYLEGIRDVERSITAAVDSSAASASCKEKLDFGSIGSSPNDWPKVSRALFSVMGMALGCGVTRVASLVWGGGQCNANIPWFGINDWHITTHGDWSGEAGKKIERMQTYLAEEFAFFVDQVKAYGGLQDTLLLWGTQNGNANGVDRAGMDHPKGNTPFVLAGQFGGRVRTGRVIDCDNRNHNDLYTTIAQGFGIEGDTFGDKSWCKGPLDLKS